MDLLFASKRAYREAVVARFGKFVGVYALEAWRIGKRLPEEVSTIEAFQRELEAQAFAHVSMERIQARLGKTEVVERSQRRALAAIASICEVCLHEAETTAVNFKRNTSWILVREVEEYGGRLCGPCATQIGSEFQGHNTTRGMWGVRSLIAANGYNSAISRQLHSARSEARTRTLPRPLTDEHLRLAGPALETVIRELASGHDVRSLLSDPSLGDHLDGTQRAVLYVWCWEPALRGAIMVRPPPFPLYDKH